MDADAFSLLARYNAWMNAQLFAVTEGLSRADWHRARGLFHGSIHATLDHLVYADLAFLSRLTGDPAEAPRLGETVHESRTALRRARSELDQRLLLWCRTLEPDWLQGSLRWRSQVDGALRTRPRWAVLLHVFNHHTHHRGQVTAALTALGLDYGSTDLPFLDPPDADR